METRDLKNGPATTLLADNRIRNVYWLSDGRILYAMRQPDQNGDTCNLWGGGVDNKTGHFSEQANTDNPQHRLLYGIDLGNFRWKTDRLLETIR